MKVPAGKRIVLALAAIFLVRLIGGAVLPLSADETYYWLWSRHLAAGYFDHPPVVAWLIRAGTCIFGDTALGVRAAGILLSFAASWFVWRAGAFLLGSERRGAWAVLLFNLTLMVGVETLAATPDSPSIFFASVFLWTLARFAETRDGRWWLAAGAAAGLGLLSKYSALFLGGGAALWLLASPPYRSALKTPWPYLGATLAFLIFAPNIAWNAGHQWGTFVFQFGRVEGGHLTAKYFGEFFAVQALLASPFLLILSGFGLAHCTKARWDARFLAAALIWPALMYFLLHTLHARVQGNWPCFLYPALAIAATGGIFAKDWRGWLGRARRWSALAAVPVAAMLLIAAYVQALIGVIPMGRKDPLARLLAVGMPAVSARIENLRTAEHAGAILTTDYATLGWLAFYGPNTAPVALAGEDFRFPDRAALNARNAQTALYVCEDRAGQSRLDKHERIEALYAWVTEIGSIARYRKGVAVAHYTVYRAVGPKRALIGKVP